MKILTLFGALLFGVVAIQAAANAADGLRKNETYCLESSQGGGDGGGGGTLIECRFETREQCIASKVGLSDTCMLNPVLAFARARRH